MPERLQAQVMSVARPLALHRRRFREQALGLPTLAAALLAALALLGLLYLTQTSGIATTGYDVQELEATRAQWQVRNDQLRLRIAEARSLGRVERDARLRLGMAAPERVVFVRAAPTRPTPSARDGQRDDPLDAIRRTLTVAPAWLSERP